MAAYKWFWVNCLLVKPKPINKLELLGPQKRFKVIVFDDYDAFQKYYDIYVGDGFKAKIGGMALEYKDDEGCLTHVMLLLKSNLNVETIVHETTHLAGYIIKEFYEEFDDEAHAYLAGNAASDVMDILIKKDYSVLAIRSNTPKWQPVEAKRKQWKY